MKKIIVGIIMFVTAFILINFTLYLLSLTLLTEKITNLVMIFVTATIGFVGSIIWNHYFESN
jgi:multisubunit Na+/H+ antiporter MnhF subunit